LLPLRQNGGSHVDGSLVIKPAPLSGNVANGSVELPFIVNVEGKLRVGNVSLLLDDVVSSLPDDNVTVESITDIELLIIVCDVSTLPADDDDDVFGCIVTYGLNVVL